MSEHENDAGVYSLTRWIGHERCPNGDAIHVLPTQITSSARLFNVETPGNITATVPCPFCCPTSPAKTAGGDA